MNEDIFRVDDPSERPKKLVIRRKSKAQSWFDSANKVKLDDLLRTLSDGDWPCFLSKRTDNEFLISIPMMKPAGQADLVVSYNPNNFSYYLEVFYAKKTKFRSSPLLPDPQYLLPVTASFVFLEDKEAYPNLSDLMEMQKLNAEVKKLEVPPGLSIEIQQDIWTQYVEAQSQLVDSLNEPFELVGEPRLSAEKKENGDGIYRYRLDLQLPARDLNEYRPLINALREEFHFEADIDNDGNCQLRMKDIFKGIDSIIKKRFPDRYERDAAIGCIVPVRPIPAAERFRLKYGDMASFSQRGLQVGVGALTVPFETISRRLKGEGFSPVAFSVQFRIKNVVNLYKSSHVEKFGITFSEDHSFKRIASEFSHKEFCLPEPFDATSFQQEYTLSDNQDNKYAFLEKALEFIYGKEHVEKSIVYWFRPEREMTAKGFSDEEWGDIWRDLYAYDYKYNVAPFEHGKLISFDFETPEDFEKAMAGIESVGKYQIVKSPRDEDFLFKVQTKLSSKKTQKEIFYENLKKLNGVDFVYDFPYETEDGRFRTRPVYVGKLNGYDSTSDHFVLYLPYLFKEDQKQTDQFLKFWKENGSQIDSVHANLRGDRSKLDWLMEAIAKLGTTSPIEGPNDVPVNERIRDFIFDTSKAEPVFRYEHCDIRETPEFKDFDRTAVLKLNDSQKEAVLKGVAARDLCMFQGPPGTGKTTVIAELIWQHIRQDQNTRLLLTSETNLAVDNALEKLMNEKAVNPDMARFLTLIKPLRFGKPDKFEEEGKRYSIERIEKWVDDTTSVEDDYEAEVLGEDGSPQDEEEIVVEDANNNIVQHWMRRIADRSRAGDPRYADVLKDWVMGLAMPDKETKVVFRDLYYKHVNVVGSTCPSTGSPGFHLEYLRTFKGLRPEDYKAVKTALYWWKNGSLSDRALVNLADILGCDDEVPMDDLRNAVKDACTIRFDTVIMDEASKATPPELLLPLCFGRKSIVIGDHRQLPPMLYEKSFKEALLALNTKKAQAIVEAIDRDFVNTSQFKRMILNEQVSPTIKSTFDTQYRMHPAINAVISQFYENDECGGLKCGLDPDSVDSPDLGNPQSRHHGFFKKGFISPDIHTIWVNVKAPEESDGSSKVNISEVRAISYVLEKLQSAEGFQEYMAHWDTLKEEYKRNEEKEIGVISFYGRQVSRIKKNVRPRARQLGLRTKINTVDKFQGMERNIIVVSTVRSDKAVRGTGIEVNTDPGFADSPERLNVALSRARRLLIVVGNKDFFSKIKDKQGNYIYRNVIQEIERQGKVIEYTDLIHE